MVDATGSTAYSYNAVTSGTALGQGRLGSVTGPLANSAIAYSYDALGRVTGLSINGTANTSSTAYDALGRVTSVTNPLGSFSYGYLGETGLVAGISGTAGPQANFSYYGNTGDERLQQIQNLNSASGVISQFNYEYDADGDITTWQQGNSALSGTNSFAVNYDAANQLSWATLTAGTSSVTSYSFGYDRAGNRTQNQVNSAAATSSYNNLNQLVAQSPGGLTEFRGALSKWGTVTLAGNPATVTGTAGSYQFAGAASLVAGTNTVAIVATGTSGVSGTNSYQVVVSATGSAVSPSYDADGEMTGNGAGQSYQWDAANRLVMIWYGPVGSGSSTTFTYNGLNQRAGIVETSTSGTVTSTKQFVWGIGDVEPSEERDASDNVTRRVFPQGEQISGTNYYYTRDHLGSVRELTNSTGVVQTRYSYDMWGVQTIVSGTLNSELGYAGYYQHIPSGLDLTLARPYNPNLARWLSRDPLGDTILRSTNPLQEAEMFQGPNLYAYVQNDPLNRIDQNGLWVIPPYVWGPITEGAVALPLGIADLLDQSNACDNLQNGQSTYVFNRLQTILYNLTGMAQGSVYTKVSKDKCGNCHSSGPYFMGGGGGNGA